MQILVLHFIIINDLEAVTDGLFKLIFPHKHRTYEGFLPGNDGAPGKVNEFYPLKMRSG